MLYTGASDVISGPFGHLQKQTRFDSENKHVWALQMPEKNFIKFCMPYTHTCMHTYIHRDPCYLPSLGSVSAVSTTGSVTAEIFDASFLLWFFKYTLSMSRFSYMSFCSRMIREELGSMWKDWVVPCFKVLYCPSISLVLLRKHREILSEVDTVPCPETNMGLTEYRSGLPSIPLLVHNSNFSVTGCRT